MDTYGYNLRTQMSWNSPQVLPTTTDVMEFLTGHFADIVQDTWQVARHSEWPDSQCQKKRRVSQSSDVHDLFAVLDPKSGPSGPPATRSRHLMSSHVGSQGPL